VYGNNVFFEVYRSSPINICLQVIVGWQQTNYVGPLSPGVYILQTQLSGYPMYTQTTPFTVGPPEHHVPSEYSTIQAAINASSNGDIVIVAPGTYTGDGNRDIVFLGKAITVRSTDPNDPCIVAATVIDCQDTNHRGFEFISNEGRATTLEGLTITNAHIVVMCEGGAGIYINGASPTINKCVVNDNQAELDPTSFYDACLGGGIFIGGSGNNPLITNCVINGNSVGNWGSGGGIYCDFSAQATIRNCLISNNTALEYQGTSGGMFCGSALTMTNCTIVNNSAIESGIGGIFFSNYNSVVKTMTNSIVFGNSPGQMYCWDPTIIHATYCDISGGWAGTGNINADPCFADTYNADYHLQSQAGRWNPNTKNWVKDANTSVCIDAGNPGCPLGDEPNDINNVRINMGADGGTTQASKTPAGWRSLADMTNDWQINLDDVKVFTSYWLMTGQCLPGDLNRNQTVDFKDFAIFAEKYDETHRAELNIIYNIGLCTQGLSQNTLLDQFDQTRFTVTVE
jgi:hypothetical protein